ncbi:MAG: hypothetical protein WBK77_02180 [Alphaproteobacteria bacterium]
MHQTTNDSRFASIGTPRRIWAVSAIHSNAEKLTRIHDALHEHVRPGDRIIYHGNYTGYNDDAVHCIDEILAFRRMVLSIDGMMSSDIIYLKGQQEEMWQKLLQLQFAPDPSNVLLWMLGNGLAPTLASYGISAHDGIDACRSGVMALTKWTASIRNAIRNNPGHEAFGVHHSRAAYTHETSGYPMLFVHAGLNTKKPLGDQDDHFWWSSARFNEISDAYLPFRKVVRGYDPARGGININCVTATIDGGCGFGGSLVCAGFNEGGEVIDMLEY